MRRHGKKYQEKKKLVEEGKTFSLAEAVTLVKKTAPAKFDETVGLAVRLGVDPKKTDQLVRGTVALPAGTGKKVRVLVITKSERVKEAEKAGADLAGAEEMVEKIQKGFLDFDLIIATPDMMGAVGKLGKILGPKGLMPSPKSGTVTPDIAKAVAEFKAGKLEFKLDKGGNINLAVGKVSFAEPMLLDNLKKVLEAIMAAKPSGFKGIYLKRITLSSTMGPGIPVTLTEV